MKTAIKSDGPNDPYEEYRARYKYIMTSAASALRKSISFARRHG